MLGVKREAATLTEAPFFLTEFTRQMGMLPYATAVEHIAFNTTPKVERAAQYSCCHPQTSNVHHWMANATNRYFSLSMEASPMMLGMITIVWTSAIRPGMGG